MKKETGPKASVDVFASNLVHLMKYAEVDINQMHKDLKIQKTRIRSWINARSFPTHDMMVILCNYFDHFDIYGLVTQTLQPLQSPAEKEG
jgi:plasmid maintenance system antidote protein VapI